MSLISSLHTANVESVQTTSEHTTERKTVRVSTLQKPLHSSEMHRVAPETPRSISDDVHQLKSIYSTYQDCGQPLSKEAIFHAKQKYGILNTPANHRTLGLGDSGSDSADLAARLASRKIKGLPNDSVESTIEQKAQNEAFKITFSKIPLTPPEDVPMIVNLGLKGKRDVLTRLAAQKALSHNFPLDDSTNGASGGSSLKKNKPLGSPIGNEFDANIVNPQHPAGFKSLDLSNVLDGAERKAISRINNRLYPKKVNFKNGLQTGGESGASKANKEVFKKGTLEKLECSAEQFVESQTGNERQRLNDRQYMYAKSAADAVKNLDPKALADPDFASKEVLRNMYVQQISSPVVLHQAQKLADKKLQDIDSGDAYRILFGNSAYNKIAVKIALEHYSTNQEQKKKIYLGGGLWITPEEVNVVAKNLISPVINEIDERASRQRDVDKSIERRSRTLDQEYENWNFMERTKEQNDRQLLLAMESKEQQEKADERAQGRGNYDSMAQNMDIKVQQKERELQNTKQNRENLRYELQELLSKNLSKEDDELKDWNDTCERDLRESKIEHNKVVKSRPKKLRIFKKGYEELLDEHNRIQAELKMLKASIAGHRTAIHDLKENSNVDGALSAKHGQKISSGEPFLDVTMNDPLIISAGKAIKEAELATEECMLRQLQVDEMAIIRSIESHEYERKLRKESETGLRSRDSTKGLGSDSGICQDDMMNAVATNQKMARKRESTSPQAAFKSRFLSTFNTGKDVDSSASARSVTGVSGVLDERPETSKFNKEIDLSESVAKPDKVHERADGITEGSVLIKKDNLSRPAECTPGNITIEQFLFSKNGNKQKPSKTESVTMKSGPTVDSMGLEKDDELTHRNDRGRRSFSGFSQGSVENDYSNEVTDDQDESDIRVRDSNDSHTSPKESFFKEII